MAAEHGDGASAVIAGFASISFGALRLARMLARMLVQAVAITASVACVAGAARGGVRAAVFYAVHHNSFIFQKRC